MGMADSIMLSVSSIIIVVQQNSSMFVPLRISERGAVPLISILVVSSVSDVFNGTLNITCMDFGTKFMATTTVYIAGNAVKPPIADPPRKKLPSLYFQYTYNLTTKDKTSD